MKKNEMKNEIMVIGNNDKWELKLNDHGKETIKIFEGKKEAKTQLNKMARSLMKIFNLEKFYSEKSNWYELLILADENLDEDEIADGNNITLEIKLVEEEMMEEE